MAGPQGGGPNPPVSMSPWQNIKEVGWPSGFPHYFNVEHKFGSSDSTADSYVGQGTSACVNPGGPAFNATIHRAGWLTGIQVGYSDGMGGVTQTSDDLTGTAGPMLRKKDGEPFESGGSWQYELNQLPLGMPSMKDVSDETRGNLEIVPSGGPFAFSEPGGAPWPGPFPQAFGRTIVSTLGYKVVAFAEPLCCKECYGDEGAGGAYALTASLHTFPDTNTYHELNLNFTASYAGITSKLFTPTNELVPYEYKCVATIFMDFQALSNTNPELAGTIEMIFEAQIPTGEE